MESRLKIRVGAICRRDDQVLLQRRLPEAHWAVPGGRLEAGEVTTEGVARELEEELGLRLEVRDLCAVIETEMIVDEVVVQEVGLYFIVDPNVLPHGRFRRLESTGALEFNWFRVEELPLMDVRPEQIRAILTAPDGHVPHVIHKPPD